MPTSKVIRSLDEPIIRKPANVGGRGSLGFIIGKILKKGKRYLLTIKELPDNSKDQTKLSGGDGRSAKKCEISSEQ